MADDIPGFLLNDDVEFSVKMRAELWREIRQALSIRIAIIGHTDSAIEAKCEEIDRLISVAALNSGFATVDPG